MKYRKKPIVIEALQYDGMILNVAAKFPNIAIGQINKNEFWVQTLEGKMSGAIGDYIIKGIEGEYYICEKSIFEKTYEKVS